MERQVSQSAGRGVGRPSKAQPFRSFVVDLLVANPRMKSLEIVRRARIGGYEGGKSALYAVIASLRPRRSRPLGHQDKIPGEIVRHGLGQVDVCFGDGHTRTVNFMVSRLEYSRFSVVSVMIDQSVETLVRCLVRHYTEVGGVPMLATFDRGKPIATRTDAEGQIVEWDLSFAYAAIQLGLGVQVRARRGAERGVGTNLGNWVKNGFFKDRTFASDTDLERQLEEWVAKANGVVAVENGSHPPTALLTEERQRLRPLKLTAETLALRVPVVVGPRAAVLYDDQAYAMPADAVGLVGALYLYPDKVVVVAGRYQTTHPRYGNSARGAWDGISGPRQTPGGALPDFAETARRGEATPSRA
jgi:hypothetical protein